MAICGVSEHLPEQGGSAPRSTRSRRSVLHRECARIFHCRPDPFILCSVRISYSAPGEKNVNVSMVYRSGRRLHIQRHSYEVLVSANRNWDMLTFRTSTARRASYDDMSYRPLGWSASSFQVCLGGMSFVRPRNSISGPSMPTPPNSRQYNMALTHTPHGAGSI